MTMTRVIHRIVMSSCLLFPVFAQAEVVKVEATGIGDSRPEAITHALVEGIQRATGVSIDQSMVSGLVVGVSKLDGKANQTSGLSKSSEEAHIVQTDSIGQDLIKSRSGGSVKTFTVMSSDKDNLGRYVVKVNVEVDKFKSIAPETANRMRIVVVPFQTQNTELATQLRDQLIVYLTQSKRFSVLDRTENAQYQKEMALVTSTDANMSERVRYGQVLGADFIMTGKINFKTIKQEEVNPVTNQKTVSYSATADVMFNMIEIATRQIQFSNQFKMRVAGDTDQLLEPMVQKIGSYATESLFPLRVITRDNPTALTINRGGQSLAVGQKFALVSLGAELTDPDTKEKLGRSENEIGAVEITKVDSSVSIAKLLSGAVNKTGDLILRRQADAPQSGQRPVANPNPGTKSKAFD
jgi:Peptidoglycan-synthase activator LpoB